MTPLINNSPVVAVDEQDVIGSLLVEIAELEDENCRLRDNEAYYEACVQSAVERVYVRLNRQMAELRRENAELRARLARFAGEPQETEMLPTSDELRCFIGRTFERDGERRTFVREEDYGYLGDGLIWKDAGGKEQGQPGMFIVQWIDGAVEQAGSNAETQQ